jgi:hypothetical protein
MGRCCVLDTQYNPVMCCDVWPHSSAIGISLSQHTHAPLTRYLSKLQEMMVSVRDSHATESLLIGTKCIVEVVWVGSRR